MKRSPFVLGAVGLAASSFSCNLWHKSEHAAKTGAAGAPAFTMSAPAGVDPLPSLGWKPLSDPSFVGLPQGCTLGTTLRRAPLPAAAVRFFAPPRGSELIMALGTDGKDVVERAGIIDADGARGAAFPWTTLSAPPIVGRTSSGFIAFRAVDNGDGQRSAELWAPPHKLQHLVAGDRLDVVDATCSGATCALLTSVASTSGGPGATVLVGDPASDANWRRTDLAGEEQSWAPFSIVDLTNGVVTVALSGKGTLGVWRVDSSGSARVATIDAPYGAYDVLLADVSVAVLPGESVEGECKKDGFPVRVARADGKVFEIDGHVPPETVVTRRLDGGFVVSWLSPVRCRIHGRQMVRAFLLGPDGSPRTSTMAVAEADGFALSTHGSELDLWLAGQTELVWVKGTCRLPEPRGGAR